jgi:hypothetical protein
MAGRHKWMIMSLAVGMTVAVAAVLIAATSWRHDLDRQRYAVAMPPPDASARQVVLAYVRALDAHDVVTAEGLSTFGYLSTTRDWLTQA